MSDSPSNAAIYFHVDGYDLTGPRPMGRQSAGHGFLRAAVQGRDGETLVGFGFTRAAGGDFSRLVKQIDPSAETRWIRTDQIEQLGAVGVCYRPDPSLVTDAQVRLRVGPAHHSLCGVTHTLSPTVCDAIAGFLTAPLTPWDAVICTSTAARQVIERVLEEQAAYLAWRLGPTIQPSLPQFPVIPLGVHCQDFAFSDSRRATARQALGLEPDQVAVLYAGRLAFADKAHPYPMFLAMQAVAERTGAPATLVMAGKFLNEFTEKAFRSGAAQFCPDVRLAFVNGADFEAYHDAWAAADIFLSTSDSVQETFGLTPVEAMAAALPVVVSDWNGYRDTVRDGVDGFRVRSWAPMPGVGQTLARDHETGVLDIGRYSWGAAASTSIDQAQLVDRLCTLIADPDLRRRMGEAGRARARSLYDWSTVYSQYQALWREMNARRRAAAADSETVARLAGAPRATAGRYDPFATFSHYPTGHVGPDTRISLEPAGTLERYRELCAHNLFYQVGGDEKMIGAMFEHLAAGPASAAQMGEALGLRVARLMLRASILAKMGLVRLEPPSQEGARLNDHRGAP